MKRNSLDDTILLSGLFSFLVLITASGLITTYTSHYAVYLIRLIAATFVSIATAFTIVRLRFPRTLAISLVLYMFAFIYAVAAATLTGGFQFISQSLAIDFILSFCGIVLFGTQFNIATRVLPDAILPLFMFYSMGAFLLTFITGGVIIGLPPQFVFDVASDDLGRAETYNLMLTSYFMLAAIFAASGFARFGLNARGSIYFILLLLFLVLSILGGGRGELVSGLIIVAFVLFRERKVRWISIVTFGVIAFAGLVLAAISLFEDMVIVQRLYLIYEGDLSDRDILLEQVIDLLVNEPRCLIVGCGPGYFQRYYAYDFGSYPHNSIAEAIVIFGFPLLIIGLAFAAIGFEKYFKKVGGLDLYFLLFIYSAFISLKSGYLFGSWVLVSGFFVFIGIGFARTDKVTSSGARSSLHCTDSAKL